MRTYASLDLRLSSKAEAPLERITYTVTAYMDALGFMPCSGGSAERTVCLVQVDNRWVLYDDCADRLDTTALDGLGRCLTEKLHTRAIGVLGSGEHRMLRLYTDGRLNDTFITSPEAFKTHSCWYGCSGHAIRWRALLAPEHTIRELTAAFAKARKQPEEGFAELCTLLGLGKTSTYGFASIEDAAMQGVITMYFCAANRIRDHWYQRLFRPLRSPDAAVGVFWRRSRCRPWQ